MWWSRQQQGSPQQGPSHASFSLAQPWQEPKLTPSVMAKTLKSMGCALGHSVQRLSILFAHESSHPEPILAPAVAAAVGAAFPGLTTLQLETSVVQGTEALWASALSSLPYSLSHMQLRIRGARGLSASSLLLLDQVLSSLVHCTSLELAWSPGGLGAPQPDLSLLAHQPSSHALGPSSAAPNNQAPAAPSGEATDATHATAAAAAVTAAPVPTTAAAAPRTAAAAPVAAKSSSRGSIMRGGRKAAGQAAEQAQGAQPTAGAAGQGDFQIGSHSSPGGHGRDNQEHATLDTRSRQASRGRGRGGGDGSTGAANGFTSGYGGASQGVSEAMLQHLGLRGPNVKGLEAGLRSSMGRQLRSLSLGLMEVTALELAEALLFVPALHSLAIPCFKEEAGLVLAQQAQQAQCVALYTSISCLQHLTHLEAPSSLFGAILEAQPRGPSHTGMQALPQLQQLHIHGPPLPNGGFCRLLQCGWLQGACKLVLCLPERVSQAVGPSDGAALLGHAGGFAVRMQLPGLRGGRWTCDLKGTLPLDSVAAVESLSAVGLKGLIWTPLGSSHQSFLLLQKGAHHLACMRHLQVLWVEEESLLARVVGSLPDLLEEGLLPQLARVLLKGRVLLGAAGSQTKQQLVRLLAAGQGQGLRVLLLPVDKWLLRDLRPKLPDPDTLPSGPGPGRWDVPAALRT